MGRQRLFSLLLIKQNQNVEKTPRKSLSRFWREIQNGKILLKMIFKSTLRWKRQ